jgi:hypothetical protein
MFGARKNPRVAVLRCLFSLLRTRSESAGLSCTFLALAAIASGGLSAQATPLPAPAKTYLPVEQIGCRGPGTFCPAGLHWVCDLYRCRCAPCAYGGPRPYWGRARMPPSGGPSASGAPRATAMHYVVLDEAGHCTVVDSKPSAGSSSLKIVGDQGGYTSLESANKALKDSKAECKDVVGVGAEAKFKTAQAKAQRDGVETLTQKDIEGLSLEQIKQLRGY